MKEIYTEKRIFIEEQVYRCSAPNCDRVFKTRFALKRHFLIHSNEKNHSCPLCGKRFSLPQYLKEHVNTHTQEKPYVCGIDGCKESFRQAGKLSLHKRTHPDYVPKRYCYNLNPKRPKKKGNKKSIRVEEEAHSTAQNDQPQDVRNSEMRSNKVKKEEGDSEVVSAQCEDLTVQRLKPLPSLSVALGSLSQPATSDVVRMSEPIAVEQKTQHGQQLRLFPMMESLPLLMQPQRISMMPIMPAPNPYCPTMFSYQCQSIGAPILAGAFFKQF